VVFNYRGYGASTGSPDPNRLQSDGITVAKCLQDELGIVNLVVHGESVGGMVACGIARQVELQGILVSSDHRHAHHSAVSVSLSC
jgi:homoserine acetyltransferase